MQPFLLCIVSLYFLFICTRARVIFVERSSPGGGGGPGRRAAAGGGGLAGRGGTADDVYLDFDGDSLPGPARRICGICGVLICPNAFAAPAVFSLRPSRGESFPKSVILRYYRFKLYPTSFVPPCTDYPHQLLDVNE